MEIRFARERNLQQMVELDRKAYGKYGVSIGSLSERLKTAPESILVTTDGENIKGFIVFEILNKNNVPKDFFDMKITEQFEGKWMYNIVFTT